MQTGRNMQLFVNAHHVEFEASKSLRSKLRVCQEKRIENQKDLNALPCH